MQATVQIKLIAFYLTMYVLLIYYLVLFIQNLPYSWDANFEQEM